MGKFTLFKSDKDDQFYFNLKADNHEIILQSQGYTSKQNCEKGIASVRINSVEDERFEQNIAKNEEFYFILKAANGETLGKSETYTSKAAMQNGIRSVQENAPEAEIVEIL